MTNTYTMLLNLEDLGATNVRVRERDNHTHIYQAWSLKKLDRQLVNLSNSYDETLNEEDFPIAPQAFAERYEITIVTFNRED